MFQLLRSHDTVYNWISISVENHWLSIVSSIPGFEGLRRLTCILHLILENLITDRIPRLRLNCHTGKSPLGMRERILRSMAIHINNTALECSRFAIRLWALCRCDKSVVWWMERYSGRILRRPDWTVKLRRHAHQHLYKYVLWVGLSLYVYLFFIKYRLNLKSCKAIKSVVNSNHFYYETNIDFWQKMRCSIHINDSLSFSGQKVCPFLRFYL